MFDMQSYTFIICEISSHIYRAVYYVAKSEMHQLRIHRTFINGKIKYTSFNAKH